MGSDRLRTWMTAVFCCVLNFLMVGLTKIAGLLFVETKSHFHISRQSASLPYILSSISRSFAAPISGFAGHAYGLRMVIVAGCVTSSFGVFACFFATNVWFIYILWGGVVGFGVGLTNSLLPQVININFKNDFSKANGISVAGVPLAGLLLSPIVEYLLRTYGLSGTFLILSAITFHGVPVAMMLKLPTCKLIRKRKSNNQNKPNDETSTVENSYNPVLLFSNQSKHQSESSNIVTEHLQFNRQIKTTDTISANVNDDKVMSKFQEKVPKTISVIEDFNNGLNTNNKICSIEDCDNHTLIYSVKSTNQKELSNNAGELESNSKHRANFRCPKSFQVFTNVTYLLIAISYGSLLFLSFAYPTLCTDFALDKGLSITESTYLLMIVGGIDIIPRVTLGWVTDRGYMTRPNFCALFYFLSTISILWTVWTVNLMTMAMAVGLQSFSMGALYPVIPGIIPKYVEKDQQTIAIASAPFFLVPLSASTPSLIGYFKDELGSYNALMYFFSVISLLNCIFLLLLPRIDKWRRKRNQKPEEETEN